MLILFDMFEDDEDGWRNNTYMVFPYQHQPNAGDGLGITTLRLAEIQSTQTSNSELSHTHRID
jgi:hypothetical protein